MDDLIAGRRGPCQKSDFHDSTMHRNAAGIVDLVA